MVLRNTKESKLSAIKPQNNIIAPKKTWYLKKKHTLVHEANG